MFKEIMRYILRGGPAVKVHHNSGVVVHDSSATLPEDDHPSPVRRESIFDLAKFYQSAQRYTGLVLSGQNIDDRQIKIIFRSMSSDTNLKYLDLSRNFITEAGIEGLSSFPFARTLHSFKIGRNAIGDSGASELASILRASDVLQHLSLNEIGMGQGGAGALAGAVRANNSLKYLSLDNNHVGDKGARELANSLNENSTLQFLRCDSNEIGDAGAKSLAIALHQGGMALKYLSLNNNQIKDSGAEEFSEALRRSSALEIKLRGNYVSGEVEGRLKDEFGERVNLLDQKISFEEMGFWNETILPGTQNMNLEGEPGAPWGSGSELQEEGASTNGGDQAWEMQDMDVLGAAGS